MTDPIATWETITPDKAAEYLKFNTHNRHLRIHRVNAYAKAMLRGEWMETHQGVAFTDSFLLDGQTRLHAIIKSGTTQRMLVVRGLPDAAFQVVDTGLNRSVSDNTKLDRKVAEVSRLFAGALEHKAEISHKFIGDLAERMGLDEYHAMLPKANVKTWGQVGVRTGVILLLLEGYLESYILSCIQAIVSEDLAVIGASPVLSAYYKGVKTINSSNKNAELIAWTAKAFSPKNKNLKRLTVSEDEIKQVWQRMRDVAQ